MREIAVLGNASQNIATAASYNSIYLMERPKDNGAKEGRPLHTPTFNNNSFILLDYVHSYIHATVVTC